jgi:putative nucleotidyltransferase with HDIG domain
MTAGDVKTFTRNIRDLSTIPGLLQKIISVVQHEGSSAKDLLKLISHDLALAEKVVRVANSAFFGHSGEVKDLRQAFIFLGLDKIKSIALGMTVMDMFPVHSSFDVKNLWRHGYEVAIFAEALSGVICMTGPQECFLAGLLHDIGRIIFYQIDPKKFLTIVTTDNTLVSEEEVFGCTHAEAGAWFAEENSLPPEIISAIRFHHRPSGAKEYKDTVSIISLAEVLSRRFNPQAENDGKWTEEHDLLLLEYSLTDDDILSAAERFFAHQPGIYEFFTAP